MSGFYIKRFLAAISIFLQLFSLQAQAQLMPMEIIHYSGSPTEVTNMVIVGDGYTAAEQDKFIIDAQKVTAEMLSQPPWKDYHMGINVYALKVVSNVSGAAVDPKNLIDNYFGSSFGSYNIDRLLVAWRPHLVSSVLFTNTPFFDIGVIMVNDMKYGGSGGTYAVFSTNHQASELMIHELGHSFGDLADEYWAGPQYARERHNMSQTTSPEMIKWKNFLYSDNIGIFPHEESPTWQRPHQNCKMRFLGRTFCKVCSHHLEKRLEVLSTPGPSIPPLGFYGANKLEIETFQKVNFFDLSSYNPTSWEWTFEGGTPEISNEKNPEIMYKSKGKFKVTLKAINEFGENLFARSDYIIVTEPAPDHVPPVIITKEVKIQLNEDGKASIRAIDIDNGTYDDVALTGISISKEMFSCADLGINKIIFKAIDSSGNEAQSEVLITVEDLINPTIIAKDVEIFLDSEGVAFLTPSDIDEGSFDNCSISEVTLSKSEFGMKDAGKNKVMYTIKDASSNTASREITVNVNIILANNKGEYSEKIKVYPNPANEMVFIEYLNTIDSSLVSIDIVDANGRVMNNFKTFERNGNVIPIDIKGLKTGQYFMRLNSQRSMKILRFTISK